MPQIKKTAPEKLYDRGGIALWLGDCRAVAESMADNSVDLLLTDPPYFKMKDEHWDNQWSDEKEFLSWLGGLLDRWYKLVKPNGSLYVFSSPRMSARVEVEVGKRFNPLNRIRWVKDQGWHKKAKKEELRSFLSPWEEIIFAEHYGADNIAKGEAGYEAKCDELRGFVFEPLRAYLAGERDRAGVDNSVVNEMVRRVTGSANGGMSSHWFSQSQWCLPTERFYLELRTLFNAASGGDFLKRDYESLRLEYESLRLEYESLRLEYESLRRPFSVFGEAVDVWRFKTVSTCYGKHVCEKPVEMMEYMVRVSSRKGALVFDPFLGSGSTALAAFRLGRRFVGCDLDRRHVELAVDRLRNAEGGGAIMEIRKHRNLKVRTKA